MSFQLHRTAKEVGLRGSARVTLLEKLGLEGVADSPKALRAVEEGKNVPVTLLLGEGTFEDPANQSRDLSQKQPPTGGALALQSQISLDADRKLTRLSVDLFTLHPSAAQSVDRLFDLEVNGEAITSIRILGTELDARVLDDYSPRVIETIQRIHREVREKRFPKLGDILSDLATLNLIRNPGQLSVLTADGGFNFRVMANDRQVPSPTWSMPERFLPEILGFGRNDIDPQNALPAQVTVSRTHERSGEEFLLGFGQEVRNNGRYVVAATRIFDGRTGKPVSTPDPFALSFHVRDGEARLDNFSMFGDYSVDAPPAILQQRIGAVNAINTALRQRAFPSFDDVLAEYDQLGVKESLGIANVGTLGNETIMTLRRAGGNNVQELLPGLGGTIGINCDILMAHWQDDRGRNKRKGIIIDPGKMFNRIHEILQGRLGDWDYAIADVQAYLKDVDDVFITHWHEDHVSLTDLARRGLLVGKNVHLLRYAAQVMKTEFENDAFLKRNPHLWPNIVSYEKPELVHINGDGQRRMTVSFGGLIPHTTDCSPVIVASSPYICGEDGKALHATPKRSKDAWTWATLGDCTFGPFNVDNYSGGVVPPDPLFTRDLWKIYVEQMQAAYPDLGRDGRRRLQRKPADLVFVDATNADQDGWAPDIVKGERDLVDLGKWCSGLALRLMYFSSNKRGDEMVLRAALRMQRHVTVAGLNHQRRWRDLDQSGLRFYGADGRVSYLGIQEALGHLARQYQIDPTLYLTLGREKVRELFQADPGKMIVVATGGLNTPIEVQAHGPKAATGRDGFFKHPRYSRTSFGLPPGAFLNIIAQSAFSGTEEDQRRMAYDLAFGVDATGRRTQSGGSMVVLVTHNGSYFYNVKEPYITPIRDGLEQQGYKLKPEPSIGGFYVPDFLPTYASGHGRRQDHHHMFGWLHDNGIRQVAAAHYGEIKKANALHETARANGLTHPTQPISNWVVYTMRDGKLQQVGSAIQSAVIVRHDYPFGEHWNGDKVFARVVFDTGFNGQSLPGFFHSPRGVYVQKFGTADADEAQLTARTTSAPLRHGPETSRHRAAPAVTDFHLLPLELPNIPLPREMPRAPGDPSPGGKQ